MSFLRHHNEIFKMVAELHGGSDEKHQFFYLPTHTPHSHLLLLSTSSFPRELSWALFWHLEMLTKPSKEGTYYNLSLLEKILSSKLKKSKNTFWKFFEKSLHFFESLLFLWRILKILALFCDSYAHHFFNKKLNNLLKRLVLRLWKLEVTQVLAWKFAGWSFSTSVNRGGF